MIIVLPATVILINFCCVAHLYSMNSTELFWGTRMTRMQRINPDLISANLFNPCHQCSIHLLNTELDVQERDAIKV